MPQEIIEKSKLENDYNRLPKIDDENITDLNTDDSSKPYYNKDFNNNNSYKYNYHYNNYENHYHKSHEKNDRFNNFIIILGIVFGQIWFFLLVLYFIVNRRKKGNFVVIIRNSQNN